MREKAKAYLNESKSITEYTDSDVETIALIFIVIIMGLLMIVRYVFLTITCPLWLVPYCLYKRKYDRKE